MLHGISAYNKTRGIWGLINRVATVSSGVEICTANVAIGSIGVAVDGVFTGAFKRDCWSYIENGRRQNTYGYNMMLDVKRPEHIAPDEVFCSSEVSKVLSDAIKGHKKSGTKYAEFWMKDCQISYIWCIADASDYVKKSARVIARHFGVAVLYIEKGYNVDAEYVIDNDYASEIDVIEEQLNGY